MTALHSPFAPARLSFAVGSALAALVSPLAQAQNLSPASPSTTLPVVEVRESAIAPDYTAPVSVGGKKPLPTRQIPQSVSVITEQRMRDQNLSTVTEVLQQATGVTMIANDSTQSQLRSRGFSLGVTYDGVPAYNALSGYQQFDLALYERLEILRGPSGIFTGTGEPGGVLNVVRKRPRADRAFTADMSVGSWNHHRVSHRPQDFYFKDGYPLWHVHEASMQSG